MPTVIVANKRELPPDIPPMAWWMKVNEYQESKAFAFLPWYDSQLEYLRPEELDRVRAKALVWLEITGNLPKDITCWWEIRNARKRGELPLSDEVVDARIDENGVLHCGHCAARWSSNSDGTPHGDRCFNLCGRLWRVVEDLREKMEDDNGVYSI